MSLTEQVFLGGIISAFSLFALALAFAARSSPFHTDKR